MNKHTVIVFLEAKPGSEQALKEELLKVKRLSKEEKSCIEYHVYEDMNNPARLALYENWESKEEHAKQFEKSYILELGKKLENILLKPYEVVMGQELN